MTTNGSGFVLSFTDRSKSYSHSVSVNESSEYEDEDEDNDDESVWDIFGLSPM